MKSRKLAALATAVVLMPFFGQGLSIALSPTVAYATTCTPTGFVRDGINLTATLIDPVGTVTDDVDATGCNIGVYYSPSSAGGTIDGVEIYGANYFGVVNNGVAVDISDSDIHDIGESPLNGAQHGVAIYFAADSEATGTIADNHIWNYQKGGIVVSGPLAQALVQGNEVEGQGPVDFIAQNGIQISYGATAEVVGNTTSGNDYTPDSWVSCGLLLYDADGVRVSNNAFRDNERNYCNYGKGGGNVNIAP